ncbi:unnamed protein product [marine sediment metagenome]|uniref:Uncharacterized protein n=1 Tax=marine sediment metagenome TaxID=412755 RepID=X0SJK0_9ZZZZ
MAELLFYGLPRRLGGACTERFATSKILSEYHHIYYTPDSETCADDEDIVNKTLEHSLIIDKEERKEFILDRKPIVIGMCSGLFRRELMWLVDNDVTTIDVPCMCHAMHPIDIWYAHNIYPTHTIFQSMYQAAQFSEYEIPQISVVRGMYAGFQEDVQPQTGKMILKLCRDDPAKFTKDYWDQCQIIYDRTGYRTRVVGLNEEIMAYLGEAPDCVEPYMVRSLSLEEAFDGCSYLFGGFDVCKENYPQISFEALDHGCMPLWTEDSGGAIEQPFMGLIKDMDGLCDILNNYTPDIDYCIKNAETTIRNAEYHWLTIINELKG